MNIRNYLKSARAGVGLSQKEVADCIGVSERSYMCWENGTISPRSGKLHDLRNLLNLDLNILCEKINRNEMEREL